MAISQAYKNTLKRRAIERFVKKNRRSPTKSELLDLVFQEQRNYPSVDQIGVSGYDINKPQFQEDSSVETENTNRKALFDDMSTISRRIDSAIQLLEDSYRSFNGTVRRTKHMLSQVETRLDNLLLLHTDIDEFVYGVEETFDLQDFIDFSKTTASVESGYVTMGRTGYATVDLTDAKLTYAAVSEKGIIGSQATAQTEMLKEDDGTLWEHLVYTKYRQGRVSLMIDVDLDSPRYVNDVRVAGVPISVNEHTTASLFYSLDGQTYTAIEPVEIALTEDEYQFNVGHEDVHKIRLVLSKGVADNITTTSNQYVYVFALDSLKILADKYTSDTVSTLYAGPYELVDEFGDPVYFTKATCNACVVSNDETAVNFFLSKDGVTYLPVNTQRNALGVVSFANGSKTGTFELIDDTLGASALVESADAIEDLNLTTEALLNVYIDETWVQDVSLRSIVLKRNTVGSSTNDVYQVAPGWYFDEETQQYSTTIYVDSPDGRYIDLGGTGAYVNGTLVSGEILLRKGYTVFSTSDTNWIEIPSGLSNLGSLKRADPLYPYNHRYLIEGYDYPDNFTSERVYNGVEEYFARLLKYVPPEDFNSLETDGNLGIYTVDDPSGDMYFKVKVDKTDASWKDEEFEADWLVHADDSNLIWVKAELTASNDGLSPVIEKFGVRVI